MADPSNPGNADPSPKTRISSLFRYIETLHLERRWGQVLDAGTGVKSLEWITTLATESWTAITASHRMADKIRDEPGISVRPQDRLLVGNWINNSLLTGETFDTVLVDYLIGAIEGFSPYWQGRLLERLRPLLRPDGRLYIIGLEPYVPFKPGTESGTVIWEIGRARDACLLLAGERPYREYPADWVLQRLGQAGYRVAAIRHFPIRFGEQFINSQLDMCLDRLTRFACDDLATSMRRYVEDLRARALALQSRYNGLRHGRDYVIAAEPM